MFLLIHLQVLLSIWFYGVFLIFKHCLLHSHKLADSICFKRIKQVLKTIFEMLSVLIYHLRNDLAFAIVIEARDSWVSIRISCVFLWIMNGLDNIWIWDVFFVHLFGIEQLGQVWSRLLGRGVLCLFFPTFRNLLDVVKVSFLDKLFHIHFWFKL